MTRGYHSGNSTVKISGVKSAPLLVDFQNRGISYSNCLNSAAIFPEVGNGFTFPERVNSSANTSRFFDKRLKSKKRSTFLCVSAHSEKEQVKNWKSAKQDACQSGTSIRRS